MSEKFYKLDMFDDSLEKVKAQPERIFKMGFLPLKNAEQYTKILLTNVPPTVRLEYHSPHKDEWGYQAALEVDTRTMNRVIRYLKKGKVPADVIEKVKQEGERWDVGYGMGGS